MESRAFGEFGNGVWNLFAALFEASAPVLLGHWVMTTIVSLATLYMAANIWMIRQSYGSIAGAFKEGGPKEGLMMLFLGVPQTIWIFFKLLSPEDGEEDEA
ncbi:hypothetical protein HGA34_00545 [Candidatus Falkowbacteria bacterium]|nr:hypothetical protein [Candidatus Falkowbacteria bacterium]